MSKNDFVHETALYIIKNIYDCAFTGKIVTSTFKSFNHTLQNIKRNVIITNELHHENTTFLNVKQRHRSAARQLRN